VRATIDLQFPQRSPQVRLADFENNFHAFLSRLPALDLQEQFDGSINCSLYELVFPDFKRSWPQVHLTQLVSPFTKKVGSHRGHKFAILRQHKMRKRFIRIPPVEGRECKCECLFV
jgi:hypothetical protein